MFAGAVLFGRSDPVQSLVDSLQADAPVVASGPSWEGWAEPPAYTGKPAVYLNDVEKRNDPKPARGHARDVAGVRRYRGCGVFRDGF